MKYKNSNNIYNLLFSDRVARNNQRLFKNQSDLARAIHKDLGKSFNSTRSFLNQILNGNRPATKEIEQIILARISERISPKIKFEDFEIHFVKLIDNIRKPNSNKVLDSMSELEMLLKTASRAKTVIAMTCEPAEKRGHKVSERLTEQLLVGLRLLKSNQNFSQSYQFYFPDKITASQFWEGVFEFLKENTSHDNSWIVKNLKKVNFNKLKVYYTKPENKSHVIIPVVIYDLDEPGERAFVVSYEKKSVSIARLSEIVIEKWKAYIFSNIKSSSNEYTFKNAFDERISRVLPY